MKRIQFGSHCAFSTRNPFPAFELQRGSVFGKEGCMLLSSEVKPVREQGSMPSRHSFQFKGYRMNNRRAIGHPGISALAAMMLLVLWGCPPAPAPESETPEPTKAQEESSEDSLETRNQELLDRFQLLEEVFLSKTVSLRISLSEGYPGPEFERECFREIKVEGTNPEISWAEGDSEHVTWQVAADPFDLWMSGDKILIERKEHAPDCFSPPYIPINYPARRGESGEIMDSCRQSSPVSWQYKGALSNKKCETDENPDGKVASWDPLVIIKPRPPA